VVIRKFLEIRRQKQGVEWQMPVTTKSCVISEFIPVALVLLMLVFISMAPYEYISSVVWRTKVKTERICFLVL